MIVHYLNSKGEEKFIDGVVHLQNVDNSIFIASMESGGELKLRISGIEGIYYAENSINKALSKPSGATKESSLNPRQEVKIYTDGACKGNPGPGGWGAIIVIDGKEIELFGGEASTTNNRMELTAVISSLSFLDFLETPCNVTLTSDSKYVVDAIEKGWLENWEKHGWKKADKTPVLNTELWQQLTILLNKHNVNLVWIKGHAGHEYNERCDKLAQNQARERQ